MARHLRFAALAITLVLVTGAALRLVPEWSVGDLARRVIPYVQRAPWLYWLPGYAALVGLVGQVAWLRAHTIARFSRSRRAVVRYQGSRPVIG